MIFIIIAALVAFITYVGTRSPKMTIGITALATLACYIYLPTLNWYFYGVPMLITLIGGINLAYSWLKQAKLSYFSAVVFSVGLIFLSLIPAITSWTWFYHWNYQELLGEVNTEAEFADVVKMIDVNELHIDAGLAKQLAEQKLGKYPELDSQFAVGEMTKQWVGNKTLWVAPLVFPDIWSWSNNQDGTPGYITVSTVNTADVELVQHIDSKPIRIKYQPAAWFSDDLERHLYQRGFHEKGLTNYTFELDDEGHPFYVATLYNKTIGYSGSNAYGILVIDPATGHFQERTLESADPWVEHVQPAEFIREQQHDWGYYVHGWHNPSNKDRIIPTEGMEKIYDDRGNAYWVSGMTTIGRETNVVGFILTNTRTKETSLVKVSGAAEKAIQKTAEELLGRQDRLTATFPRLSNIDNRPTYIMTFKDKHQLSQLYVFASVEDYRHFVIDSDLLNAQTQYLKKISQSEHPLPQTASKNEVLIESNIRTINTDLRNGNTTYYVLLEKAPKLLFFANADLNEELVVSSPGDKVRIKYNLGTESITSMIAFDNLDIDVFKLPEHLMISRIK